MISVKTDGKGQTHIEVEGRNLLLLAELIAAVDAVSRTMFKSSEKVRVEFLKDLPELVLGLNPDAVKAVKLPFSAEQLKKIIEEGEK